MKIHGETIKGPEPEVIVIPKGSKDFVFKALPVMNYDDFEKLCPRPVPPEILMKGGERKSDINDKEYLKKIDDWSHKKISWMVLESLKATEGLEWETVDISDPDTWKNYQSELSSVFTDNEVSVILSIVWTACGLNEKKIKEATDRFLAGQGEVQESSFSPSSEVKTTPSGELVKE